jgi:hypothetical protein
MKKIKLFNLLIFAFVIINFYGKNNFYYNDSILSKENHYHNDIEDYNCLENSDYNIVYVCTGNYAYAYHSVSNCPGLNNCQGEIKYTDEYNAINNLNKVPCCRCWNNVSNRCKDDNPYYRYGTGSSNDNSEAYAYVAIGIAVASAALLSNDIYVYPTFSFYKDDYSNNINIKDVIDNMGWSFGFRKTFNNSALEYGAGFRIIKYNYNYNFYDIYYINEEKRWGVNLNYVHNIFYNDTPEKLKIYVGPTINYIYNEIGYGGIVGLKYNLVGRLSFDVRYERSTLSNQIQTGLIFNYQKKYLWQK